MVKVQHFDASTSSNFERNMDEVGERVKEYRERMPTEGMSEHEIVKEAVKTWGERPVGAEQEIEVKERPDFLPNYIGSEREGDVRAALDRLVEVALHGDLLRAVRDARKLTPFLEDTFHDALGDKILPLMKEKGLL